MFQRHLGLALGGAPAARMAHRLAMPVRGDTLLRLVRAAPLPTAIEVRKRATHAPRRPRHAELRRLSEAGASIASIARALDLDRKTVRVWLCRDAPPSWQRRRAVPTILDPYRDHLEARW